MLPLFSVVCGPNGRMSFLFAERYHDTWCSHSGTVIFWQKRITDHLVLSSCPTTLRLVRSLLFVFHIFSFGYYREFLSFLLVNILLSSEFFLDIPSCTKILVKFVCFKRMQLTKLIICLLTSWLVDGFFVRHYASTASLRRGFRMI